MEIHGDITIKEIQETFRQKFPGLDLRFFSKPHESHEGSMASFEIDVDKQIKEVTPDLEPGTISLADDQSVEHFENEFKKRFNLTAQVYRRSAELWLQTIGTDDWTLFKQNRKGISSMQKTGKM